jgi:hypothetical protein
VNAANANCTYTVQSIIRNSAHPTVHTITGTNAVARYARSFTRKSFHAPCASTNTTFADNVKGKHVGSVFHMSSTTQLARMQEIYEVASLVESSYACLDLDIFCNLTHGDAVTNSNNTHCLSIFFAKICDCARSYSGVKRLDPCAHSHPLFDGGIG